MENSYIFLLEGKNDELILKSILPNNLTEKIRFINGQGYSSSISIARTLMIKEKLPLVFILDSDTTNPNEIEKKKSIIDDYLSPFGANRYKIFMFSPEIETIFFTNPKAIETFFGISISDKSLLYNPKEYLNHLCMNKNITYEYFLNNIKNLDENALNDLRENNTIKEILNSLPHI